MQNGKPKTILIVLLVACIVVLGVLLYRAEAQVRATKSETLNICHVAVGTINNELFGMETHNSDAAAQLITRAQGSAETASLLLDGIADPSGEEAMLQEYFTVIRARAPIILKADSDTQHAWFEQTAHYLSTGDLESLKTVIDGINALAE